MTCWVWGAQPPVGEITATQAKAVFQTVKPVTLFSGFKLLTFRHWDEWRRKWASFRVWMA